MGLIRKTLAVGSLGVVRPSSKKQRVAKKTLKSSRLLNKQLEQQLALQEAQLEQHLFEQELQARQAQLQQSQIEANLMMNSNMQNMTNVSYQAEGMQAELHPQGPSVSAFNPARAASSLALWLDQEGSILGENLEVLNNACTQISDLGNLGYRMVIELWLFGSRD